MHAHAALCLMVALAIALFSPSAYSQADSAEARLREALRRATVELRAAQDSQAALQASLDQMTQQRDQLQKHLAEQAVAAASATRAAPDPEIAQLRSALQAAQEDSKSIKLGLQKWQAAYQQAADLARNKDAESQQRGQALQAANGKLGVCTTANTKLTAVADDILHLYRTQGFRALLLGSYEPLLGLKKVELENIIEDYEDRILVQKYYGDAAAKIAVGNPSSAASPAR